jgi:hypothetical protein
LTTTLSGTMISIGVAVFAVVFRGANGAMLAKVHR